MPKVSFLYSALTVKYVIGLAAGERSYKWKRARNYSESGRERKGAFDVGNPMAQLGMTARKRKMELEQGTFYGADT